MFDGLDARQFDGPATTGKLFRMISRYFALSLSLTRLLFAAVSFLFLAHGAHFQLSNCHVHIARQTAIWASHRR
jgi:hypothetical protein